MNEKFDGPPFYSSMRRGSSVRTSQISPGAYYERFRKCFDDGLDVLYICMSSGISGSYNSALATAGILRDEFPERKLRVVDTLSASMGEGLVVMKAKALQHIGVNLDECAEKLFDFSRRICQVFTVDDLKYLKRGGRLSNLSAAVGAVLHIKPLLKGDMNGRIVFFSKVRGRRRSVEMLSEVFEKYRRRDIDSIAIAHADCEADAVMLKALLQSCVPGADITTVCYEPVTGSHVGPGALALFFEGSEDFRSA